ncbi:hypothetical protein GMO_17750 [Gluconobacter morbifer G707]|uniref:Uncharacterized protein n=1 Tax=Gluconobacter morbifer G707 TaxID=1088869 RepID=G6XK46_9PROT|nr:hypothetical protein GMO_17750 [Gluconobacter morbifer G707]
MHEPSFIVIEAAFILGLSEIVLDPPTHPLNLDKFFKYCL